MIARSSSLGHGGEEGARLDQRWRFPGTEHADKGVLRQVGRVVRAAELASQPAGKPVVMVVVQHFDGIGRLQRDHSASIRYALENKNCSHCRARDQVRQSAKAGDSSVLFCL